MDEIDALLDSRKVRTASGAGTAMTLWRWQNDPRVQFPAPDVVINNRNFWRASTIRAWQKMMAERTAKAHPPQPAAPSQANQRAA
jgi:hypothetical protein